MRSRSSAPRRRAPVTSLRPVAATFLLFGAFWGAWAVAAADVQRDLRWSHGGLGLLLSLALAGAAVSNAVGGAVAERRGTGPMLSVALAGWGTFLLTGAAVHHPLVLAVVLIMAITVGGLVDVVMNVAATAALGARPGSLVRFHAYFNVGAAVGAGATALLLGALLSWRWAWVAVGLAALALAAVCARTPLPAGEAGDRIPLTGALRLLRREGLVLVAVAFAVGSIVEGGVEFWGVLYLRTHLPSGLLVGGVSAVVAYAVAAATRIVIGPIAGRRGAVRGVALGAGSAAAGAVVLALAPADWLAGAGLVLAAGGISLCWPLLVAHAGAGRTRPGAVVGAVTAVGYLGFVAGPAIVGWLSAGAGLRSGLFLLAGAAAFVAVAPTLGRRQERRTGPGAGTHIDGAKNVGG